MYIKQLHIYLHEALTHVRAPKDGRDPLAKEVSKAIDLLEDFQIISIKLNLLFYTYSSMLLIDVKNKSGPELEPCLTPESNINSAYKKPCKLIVCIQL